MLISGRPDAINRLLVLVTALLPLAAASAQTPEPGHLRGIRAETAPAPPVIDGSIGPDEWRGAQRATGFWMPAEQQPPGEQTEVFVLADDNYLYFAFRCFDASPQSLEKTSIRRDRGLGFDDQVVVEIDPFHNHREISGFAVNARGTRNYTAAGGSAAKIEWKGDWYAATSIDDDGWTAEIAIPFEILKFRSDQPTFGINFLRYHHRYREWSAWADTTPQSKPEAMGHLSVDIPDSQTRPRPWTFMPYLLTARNTVDKEGEFQRELTTGGLDLRYEPTRASTTVISLNPDFSSLEEQITDIDFSNNEKRLDDNRPFFAEGQAFFTTGSEDELYFYSNRVPDFDVGGKYFARQQASQTGILVTEDPFDRRDFAARYRYELDATHELSSMLVASDGDELQSELLMLRLAGERDTGLNYNLEAAASANDDAQIGDGDHWQASLGWSGDYWWVNGEADRFETGFFPVNGLQDADTIGTRGLQLAGGYYRSFADSPLTAVEFSLTVDARDTDAHTIQRRIGTVGGSIETRHQIRLGLFYSEGDYRPVTGDRRGEFVDEIRGDDYWTLSADFNTRSNRLGYGLSLSEGFLGGDDYRYVIAYGWLRPTSSTYLNVSAESLDNFGQTEQIVVNGSWNLTPQDSLLFRFVELDELDFNRLAYQKRVAEGTDVFVVYNDDSGSDVNYSLKLLWTFN